jgi:CheY-like chemotaxis protein
MVNFHQDRPVPGRRLLVVEDHVELRKLLELYLSTEGYTVEVAGDGAAGLARARSGDFDALVVDLAMPGMDGGEVISSLRDDPSRPPLPVVLYSGIPPTDPRVRAARELPGVAYEPKGHLRRLSGALESLFAGAPPEPDPGPLVDGIRA